MKIFNHVESVPTQSRKKYFNGQLDVVHVVASIIQYDVYLSSHFLNHLFQKLAVILGADADRPAYSIELSAVLVNVDSKNLCSLAEIPPPHVKGSALCHPNFQESNFLSPPMSEVTMVDRKIVVPFVASALAALGKYVRQVSVKGVVFGKVLPETPSWACEFHHNSV